jgi:hypothetical protein
MNKHLRYANYVFRHKWFVLVECLKLDIRLLWRGLIHDWSKLTPTEWFPYVEHFYGDKPSPRDATGAYDPLAVGWSFDKAWLSHQHHNDHHWQHHILRGDSHGERITHMPLLAMKEMLADWRGAGRAQGKPDVRAWYEANKDKMDLHPHTRHWIELQLGIIQPFSFTDLMDGEV